MGKINNTNIYTSVGGMLVSDITSEDYETLDKHQPTIVDNTVNTWQPGRNQAEIAWNTLQGKMAELKVEQYFAEHSNDFTFYRYDDLRKDGYKASAPFDETLSRKDVSNEVFRICIQRISDDVDSGDYGKIKPETRELCNACHVYLVEVKSSRINQNIMRAALDRLTPKSSFLDFQIEISSVLLEQRDIWKYPEYCRNSAEIVDYDSYAKYVCSHHPELDERKGPEYFKDITLPALEGENACDIYIQVFIEYATVNGIERMIRSYIAGYALSGEIIENKTITKFHSNKSENALYMTLPLAKCRRVTDLFHDKRLWLR